MPSAAPIRNSFARGEIGPLLYGRYDSQIYQHGCKTMQGMVPLAEGGALTFPGTVYVSGTANKIDKIRLLPFVGDENDSYAIELGDLTYRFLKNTGAMAGGTVVSSFAIADVFDIQFAQIGNVLYMFHEDYDPIALTWTSGTDTFAESTPAWTGQTFTGAGNRPRACCVHQGRLFVAKGYTVYGSKPFNYSDFTTGDLDSDGLEYELVGPERSTILWMVSAGKSGILVGFEGGEVVLTAGLGQPLTPGSARGDDGDSDFGSTRVGGLRLFDIVPFVGRDGKSIIGFEPAAGEQAYRSRELTDQAKHVTGTGIGQLAVQKHPYRMLWAVSDDGHAAVLSRQLGAGLHGWSRFVTAGTVESICVIPRNANEDMVVFSIKRELANGTDRYLEYLADWDWGSSDRDAICTHSSASLDNGAALTIAGATAANPVVLSTTAAHGWSDGDRVRIYDCEAMPDIDGQIFTVDSPSGVDLNLRNVTDTADIDGSSYSIDATKSWGKIEKVSKIVSGLDHLEGETVSVRADGGTHGQLTVSSGSITLDWWTNTAHAGLARTWTLQPTAVVRAPDGAPTRLAIHHLVMRFDKTLGVSYGTKSTDLHTVNFPISDKFEERGVLYSGLQEVPVDGAYEQNEANILLQSSDPQPAAVLTVQPETEFN